MSSGNLSSFQPGRKKAGGRKKGTPNKFKLSTLDEMLSEANLDPATELRKLLPLLTATQQAQIWMKLLDIRERKLAKSGDGAPPLPLGEGQRPLDRNPALKSMSADQLIALLPSTNANGNASRNS